PLDPKAEAALADHLGHGLRRCGVARHDVFSRQQFDRRQSVAGSSTSRRSPWRLILTATGAMPAAPGVEGTKLWPGTTVPWMRSAVPGRPSTTVVSTLKPSASAV